MGVDYPDMFDDIADEKKLVEYADKFFGPGKYVTNLTYGKDTDQPDGECDLYGFVGNLLWLVEYKLRDSERNRKDAIKQLERDEKYLACDFTPYVLAYAHGDCFYMEIVKTEVPAPRI